MELDLSAEQLCRTFARLHERVVGDRDGQAPYERALIVIETCDQMLTVIGGDAQVDAG